MPSETITFIAFFYTYKKRPKKRSHKFAFFRPQFYVYTSAYIKVVEGIFEGGIFAHLVFKKIAPFRGKLFFHPPLK